MARLCVVIHHHREAALAGHAGDGGSQIALEYLMPQLHLSGLYLEPFTIVVCFYKAFFQ